MKRFQIVMFVVALAFAACQDREPETVIVPDALKPRLLEIENSGDCYGCTVQRWTYNDVYYYHLYCSYWSCSDCEIYLFDGRLVDWTEIDRADFEAKKHRPEKIWECGDEL